MSFHNVPWNFLDIKGLILAGKFKMEFLPTVSSYRMLRTKEHIPVAQICPNSHRIDSCSIRAFSVAQIRPNSHKIDSSYVGAIPVAQICPNWRKIDSSYTGAFPAAKNCLNLHKNDQN